MEKSDSTEERTDIRATDKGKRTEKTATSYQQEGRRQPEAVRRREEIQRHGSDKKGGHVMKVKTILGLWGLEIRPGKCWATAHCSL